MYIVIFKMSEIFKLVFIPYKFWQSVVKDQSSSTIDRTVRKTPKMEERVDHVVYEKICEYILEASV